MADHQKRRVAFHQASYHAHTLLMSFLLHPSQDLQRSLPPTMDAPHRIHHLGQMSTPIANRHILVTLHTNSRLQTSGLSCNIAPIAARSLCIGEPELLAVGGREPTDGAGQSRGQEDATTARFSVILRAPNPSLLPLFKLWPCISFPPSSRTANPFAYGAGVAFWTPCIVRPCRQISPFTTSIGRGWMIKVWFPSLTATPPPWKPVLTWPEMARFAASRQTPLAISELPAGRYGMLPHSCLQQKASGGKKRRTRAVLVSPPSRQQKERCEVKQGTVLTYRMHFAQPFRFRKFRTEPSHQCC